MSEQIQYKCPHCGARIEYKASTENLKCPYCDSIFKIDEAQKFSEESEMVLSQEPCAESSGNTWSDDDGFSIYTCSSCGAELIADNTTAATKCPYCDNVVVLTERLSGQLKPDIIIPFNMTKEEAVKGLADHLKDKKLLPKVFKSEQHINEVKGVYVPFWIFSATADGSAEYSMENVRVWSDSRFNYTETSYFKGSRRGEIDFKDVPFDGLSAIDNDMTESIETFDTSKAVPFKSEYLAGYYANRYDISSDEALKRVSQRIVNTSSDLLDASVRGYSSVRRTGGSARLKNTTSMYALFPVWILNTSWKGNSYLFAMNGQTGKFVGNLPLDKKKYWLLRLLWTGVIGAVIIAAANWLFRI